MHIEFDPDKDVINRDKHGRSLADAALLEIDTAFIVPDEHRDYHEMRFQAYGLIEGRLHVLAFTVRAMASAPPPGAKVTMRRTGCLPRWEKRSTRP